MFDDQLNTGQSVPPANLPTEPVDMFADVDKKISDTAQAGAQPPDALSAGMLKPKVAQAVAPAPSVQPSSAVQAQTMPQSTAMYSMKEPVLGKIILLIVFGVLFAGLVYGGWWVYNNFISVATTPAEQNIPTIPVPAENPIPYLPENDTIPQSDETIIQDTAGNIGSEVNQQMKNDQILFGESIDSDKDGLDDVREKELGTNSFNSDTDGDDLSDGDEVLIWKTNPLNPDTDGDGYADGEEVRNGYSPLGPGKLNIIPQTATTSPAI